MTVRYTDEVATAKCAGFLKLLRRWRGSIYQLIWKDLITFLVMYYIVAVCFVYAMTSGQQKGFMTFVGYCAKFVRSIPIQLILGFYVGIIISRWDEYGDWLTFPHRDALLVSTYLRGQDVRGRLMRKTILRYFVLAYIMVLKTLCPAVQRKFPTDESMIKAGCVTAGELKVIASIDAKYNKYPIPMCWAATLIMKAKGEGRINNDGGLCFIHERLSEYRTYTGRLILTESCYVPLSYTQIVTLAVYMFFLLSMFSAQTPAKTNGFEWVPIGTIFEFLIYVGWLKVAETLINPFGDDDDDFEICHYIDRFMSWPNMIMNEVQTQLPELVKDQYWDTVQFEIPYTGTASLSKERRASTLEIGSAETVRVSRARSRVLTDEELGHIQRRFSGVRPSVVQRHTSILSTTTEESAEQNDSTQQSKHVVHISDTVTSNKEIGAAADSTLGHRLQRTFTRLKDRLGTTTTTTTHRQLDPSLDNYHSSHKADLV